MTKKSTQKNMVRCVNCKKRGHAVMTPSGPLCAKCRGE